METESTTISLAAGYVLLWDDDARAVTQTREALKEVDPKKSLLVVTKREDYDAALAGKHAETAPGALPSLVIVPATEKIDINPSIPVLVISFEHSEALVKTWATRDVFNLLIKPHDPLLLRQHLRVALAQGHPPGDFNVHNMKTNALIEMLKAATMDAVSEVGFVTRSERELHTGQVTKFYARAFEWNQKISVHARIWDQRPHPIRAGQRAVFLTWFGVPREQMLRIRERFPKNEAKSIEWRHPETAPVANILVFGDPSAQGADLAGTLKRAFPKADIQAYSDIPGPLAPLPKPLSAILVHQGLVERLAKDSRFNGVPRVILCSTVPSDEEFRALAPLAVDIETLPTERIAFMKKMMVLFPGLQPEAGDDLHVRSFEWIENLEVGQAIEVTQMNETGLVLRYERELPIGSFRHFVLWQPMESGLPTLTARCFANEKDPSREGSYLNHFVFFGMSDHEIKHVRLWMLDNYIQSKSK